MIVVEHEIVEGVEYSATYRTKKAMDIKKRKEQEANEALREDIEARGGYKESSMNKNACKEYNKKVLSGRRIVPLSDDYPPVRERTKKQQHRLNLARYKGEEAFFWACIIDLLAPNEQRTIDMLYKACLPTGKRNNANNRIADSHSNEYDLNVYYPTGKRRVRFITYSSSKGSYSLQRRIDGKKKNYISSVDYDKVVNKAQELFPEDFCYY